MTIDIYDSGVDTFRTRLFGFDKTEVRASLRNLIDEHDEAQRQVERLTARLRAVENAQANAASHDAGVQLQKVLASAHKVADDLRRDAETAASKLLTEAQEEAVRIRSDAENDAAALASSATARVAALRSEIDTMTAHRDALQTRLDDIASALDALSRELRNVAPAADSNSAVTVLAVAGS